MIAACPLPYPRGTPIRIYKMACALAEQGCEVHVIAYHLYDKLQQENESKAITIHRIPNVSTYKKYSAGPSYQKLIVLDSLMSLKLTRVLDKHKIDIIHAHHYEGLLIALAANLRRKIPVVYDAHTLLESELHYYAIGIPLKIKKLLGGFLDSQLPTRADHVITVTEDIKNKLLRYGHVKPHQISVVMNGVEQQHFYDTKKIDIDKDSVKRLLYTGSLGKYQGIVHLMKIMAQVISLRKDVRLIIATNESFKAYQSLATKLGARPYIDIVKSDFEKLPSLIHSCHVMLNPRTECDGIPQKLLNYMASGKPIVSFFGSAKVIQHNQSGLIVENNNYHAFAAAVNCLLNNPGLAKQLGANARSSVGQAFTWESRSKQVIEIYENVRKRAC